MENTQKIDEVYKTWFLDYASYVILERAVPSIDDGLKPVQRRILHAMQELEDGRYHKVANIVGHTMKYHPHGDASINDALVQLGQKNLLIDTQGNWGNPLTGDRAAASRYIEARLSPFAKEVVFNKNTTRWQYSYDGRSKEPEHLPSKFPLLLFQGAEGIAVGLSTKIMPHNFNELIDASVKVLQNKPFTLYPDFHSGGIADFNEYNEGCRGGRIRIRTTIQPLDKKRLVIRDLPFGTTTTSLIDSIIKANDKGKVRIKSVEDNTAKDVEIILHLAPQVNIDTTIQALYKFTDCEVSISPMACVIENEKPAFLSTHEILEKSTHNTLKLLQWELEFILGERKEQLFFATLERIFIENRIYRKIENQETWQGVLDIIAKELKKYIKELSRVVVEADIVRLTEIKIKRISKFDSDKADKVIENYKNQIQDIETKLEDIVGYTIDHFKNLKKTYGKNQERKTKIETFQTISAKDLSITNAKLYIDRKNHFIGTQVKGGEFLFDCSDLDDLLIIHQDGSYTLTPVNKKLFVEKKVLHCSIFRKNDKRVFNVLYRDGQSGATYAKRFHITGLTKEKVYHITRGKRGSRVIFFSVHEQAETEQLELKLKSLTKNEGKFTFDFNKVDIKGKGVVGTKVSAIPVENARVIKSKISKAEERKVKLWFDQDTNRLLKEDDGEKKLKRLGTFTENDRILIIQKNGVLKTADIDHLNILIDNEVVLISKLNTAYKIDVLYFHSQKKKYYLKSFEMPTETEDLHFIDDVEKTQILEVNHSKMDTLYMDAIDPKTKKKATKSIHLPSFIETKTIKAKPKEISSRKPTKIYFSTNNN